MTIQDVSAADLIAKAAQKLKEDKIITPPEWVPFVKTSHGRERQPTNPDWFYVRAASILRRVAIFGPLGTQKMRVHYGGRKNRGHQPEAQVSAGGNAIRKVLQQLDKAGLTKHVTKEVHKGRVVTPKGQEFLDSIAHVIITSKK